MARNSQAQKKVKKLKKSHPIFFSAIIIALILSAVGGFFTFNQIVKNDCFALIGDKEITLTVGQEYIEQGATLVSFGRDKSSSVKTSSTVDTTVAGEYYVKYTSDDFRFKNVCIYRYVIVVEGQE